MNQNIRPMRRPRKIGRSVVVETAFAHKFFEQTANNPRSWAFSAWELKEAADRINGPVLPQKIGTKDDTRFLMGPRRLLMAYSFENLLKGLYVAQGNKLAVKGKLKYPTKDPHDLKGLMSKLDLSEVVNAVSDDAKKRKQWLDEVTSWLDEATRCLLWHGRYPVPTHKDSHEQGLVEPPYGFEQDLWRRLFEHLKKLASTPSEPAAARCQSQPPSAARARSLRSKKKPG